MRSLIALQRTAGNRAVQTLARKGPDPVTATKARLQDELEGPVRDELDDFLVQRISLFKVQLAGTSLQVTVSRDYGWVKSYTRRALSKAAAVAALRTVHGHGVPLAKVRQAAELAFESEVKHREGKETPTFKGAVHTTVIESEAFKRLEWHAGQSQRTRRDSWREQLGQAELLDYAFTLARNSFDRLKAKWTPGDLKFYGVTVEQIRWMLDNQLGREWLVVTAQRHPAAAPWRKAFKNNLALTLAERAPTSEDLGGMTISQWASAVLQIASAARSAHKQDVKRQKAEYQKHLRQENLRPHEIKIKSQDEYVRMVEAVADSGSVRVNYLGGFEARGGQTLWNRRNEKIFLISADVSGVVYQNLKDGRFYRQSVEGLELELLAGTYVEVGQKSAGAAKIAKWAIQLAASMLPHGDKALLATNVIHVAQQLERNRDELRLHYDGARAALNGIEHFLPGLTDAVLNATADPANPSIFKFKAPDVKDWIVPMMRMLATAAMNRASALDPTEAIKQMLRSRWARFMHRLKPLSPLGYLSKAIVPGGKMIGVERDRAAGALTRELRTVGFDKPKEWAERLMELTPDEQKRLIREVKDFEENGSALIELVVKSVSW